MRLILSILTSMFFVAVMAQVDTLSSKTKQPTKLDKKTSKLCSGLDIPYNEEANLELLRFIKEWKGVKYCYGGNTKKCIDCSGFTSNIYKAIYSKQIPRVSRDIYSNSMPIRKNALYEGDFVFFATANGSTVSHVGVYLWDGYFAHASSSKGVTISNLRSGYYMKTFVSGGAWID